MKFYFSIFFFLLIPTISFCQDSIGDNSDFFILFNGKKKFIIDKDLKRKTIDFDSLWSDNNLIFGQAQKSIIIYTSDSVKKICSNIRAIYKVHNAIRTYQLLINNTIFWLNDSFKLQKQDPNIYQKQVVCGNEPAWQTSINQYSDSTIYRVAVTSGDDFMEKPKRYKYNFTSIIDNEITFLNNSRQLTFDGNDRDKFIYGLTPLTFIEKTKKGKYNIIKIDTSNKIIVREILIENIDNFYNPNFKPFIFQQNNLYGYCPFHKKAKYIFVMPFNGNFARFMLHNGKQGWIDIKGKEYLDELVSK